MGESTACGRRPRRAGCSCGCPRLGRLLQAGCAARPRNPSSQPLHQAPFQQASSEIVCSAHVMGCSSRSNRRYSSVGDTEPLPPVSTALQKERKGCAGACNARIESSASSWPLRNQSSKPGGRVYQPKDGAAKVAKDGAAKVAGTGIKQARKRNQAGGPSLGHFSVLVQHTRRFYINHNLGWLT